MNNILQGCVKMKKIVLCNSPRVKFKRLFYQNAIKLINLINLMLELNLFISITMNALYNLPVCIGICVSDQSDLTNFSIYIG